MALNFNEILETKVADIERPPLPPLGSWKMLVQKWDYRETTGKDGTEYDIIEFTLRGMQPGPDVDAELAAAFGDPKNMIQRHSFMFNRGDEQAQKTTMDRLKTFIEKHLAIDYGDASLKQVLPRTINAVCMANITYVPDRNDPTLMHANIKNTSAVG